MFAHDNETIFYPVAGDRVFAVSIAALVSKARSAIDSNDGGIAPAGPSPWAADTRVVDVAEMLHHEDGTPRDTVSFGVGDLRVAAMVAGRGRLSPVDLLAAVSVWADYADEADALLDRGCEEDEAMAYAGSALVAAA